MASSCSHWWHAPAYLTCCAFLVLFAIFTSHHSNPKTQFPISSTNPNPNQNPPPIPSQFFFPCNASVASQSLRKSGFNFMATLLEITPELFLPQSSNSTIFAIHDILITNISLPPLTFKGLLHYHTSPSKLTFKDLLMKPQGSCIPTLLDGKNLTITKNRERFVEINGVLISHPDIFNEGSCSIHGVLKPFTVLDPEKSHLGLEDLFQSPSICGLSSSNLAANSSSSEGRNIVLPWNQILSLLSSSGFGSFAIGLNSVLDGILQDPLLVLNSVTIFAPPDFAYSSSSSSLSSSPLLERIVRFHVLPERYTYKELISLPMNASLRTLVPDMDLEITEGFDVKEMFSINGVEITTPDVLSSDEFVVHGISQPLEIMKIS